MPSAADRTAKALEDIARELKQLNKTATTLNKNSLYTIQQLLPPTEPPPKEETDG